MNQRRRSELKPWMLFVIPAAIAVPIIAGILVGGPVVGLPVAALVAAVVVVVAIRLEPGSRKGTAARNDAPPGPDDAGDHGWRKAAARRFLVPVVIAAAGIVLIAALSGTVNIVGWGLAAVALTVAISLVFLEVGRSEDRARAREERIDRRRRPHGGPRRSSR